MWDRIGVAVTSLLTHHFLNNLRSAYLMQTYISDCFVFVAMKHGKEIFIFYTIKIIAISNLKI